MSLQGFVAIKPMQSGEEPSSNQNEGNTLVLVLIVGTEEESKGRGGESRLFCFRSFTFSAGLMNMQSGLCGFKSGAFGNPMFKKIIVER